MGQTVTVEAATQLKPDHITATTAAASVVVDPDHLVIFVGANVGYRYTEIVNGIKRCFRALSDLGNPTPQPDRLAYARLTADGFKTSDLDVSADAASITLAEDEVAVIYGDLFQEYPGQGIGGVALKALETYQEAYAKKAA